MRLLPLLLLGACSAECPAVHIPCPVPVWETEAQTLEEWERRAAVRRDAMERCGLVMAEARGSK
jgi:hypothetical protein